MKKTFLLTLVALMCCNTDLSAQGWLKRLGERAVDAAKNSVENKVENKTREAVDDVLDGKVSKKDKKSKQSSRNDDEEAVTTPAASAWTCPECGKKGNTGKFCDDCGAKKSAGTEEAPEAAGEQKKSDFVPGAVTLFEDKITGEQVGEFPSKWNLMEGICEVSKLGGETVISLPPATTQDEYVDSQIQPLMKDIYNYLPEEYTIEFDWYVYAKQDDCNDIKVYGRTGDKGGEEAFQVSLSCEDDPKFQGTSRIFFTNAMTDNNSEVDASFNLKKNAWNHFALSFNKRALKVYVNDYRIANIPNAKPASCMTLWSISRYLGNGIQNKKGTQFKNFRIAQGAVALYDQNTTDAVAKAMAETGKFVTNNINFETGKATLLPESMEEIQKVADYMLKNKSVRFEVQGHCDNQGSDKVNDPLSQSRAEAVVAALVKLGVDEWNLRAVGKGSHEPVADNKTKEGQAKNRRVEFIKK